MLAGQRRSGRDPLEAGREAACSRRQHHELAVSDRGLDFHIQQPAPQARKPPGTYGGNDAVTIPQCAQAGIGMATYIEEVAMPADQPNPRRWPQTRQTTVVKIAHKAIVAAALAAAAAVTQGCGGSGASDTAGLTASSPPPAAAAATSSGPVTHTAQVFMPGMKVTVPTSGWTVYEDHPGEFNLASPPGTTAGTNIHFWLDPYASTPHDKPIRTASTTPAALIGWLRSNPDLVVSAPVSQRIAHGIEAARVDLDVSATAPRSDPGCPGPCLAYLVWPRFGFDYGTARGEPIRLYFASLGTGTNTHTLVISIDTPNAKTFSAVIPAAGKIIDSVRLPATVSAG